MLIDKEMLLRVAKVARLELTETEIEKFLPQMEEIIGNFSLLSEVDTTGITPSFQPITVRNHMRDDEVTPSLSQDDALKNSSSKQDGYFKGPKAV